MWQQVKKKLIQDKVLDKACFTMDYWTNKNNVQVMGLTAHYVVEGKLLSAALACIPAKVKKNDSSQVVNQLQKVLGEFGVVPTFPTVITDAGGNVSKAVNNLLSWNWYRCAAHIIHNVVCAGMAVIIPPKKKTAAGKDTGVDAHDDGTGIELYGLELPPPGRRRSGNR